MSEPQSCPRCGRELPDDAPGGLCPACLIGAALATSDIGVSCLFGAGGILVSVVNGFKPIDASGVHRRS
jgi:hypothetical protein